MKRESQVGGRGGLSWIPHYTDVTHLRLRRAEPLCGSMYNHHFQTDQPSQILESDFLRATTIRRFVCLLFFPTNVILNEAETENKQPFGCLSLQSPRADVHGTPDNDERLIHPPRPICRRQISSLLTRIPDGGRSAFPIVSPPKASCKRT